MKKAKDSLSNEFTEIFLNLRSIILNEQQNNSYSRKKPKRGELRTYFFENPLGIFTFFILPLEISDKTKLRP